jgi:hypothetical protein
MEINATTLPDTPGDLKEIIIGHRVKLTDLHEAHDKETGILLEQIRHLRAQLFGRKSEKIQGGPQTLPCGSSSRNCQRLNRYRIMRLCCPGILASQQLEIPRALKCA